MDSQENLKIGLAQITPVWLNKEKTIDKIKSYIIDAGNKKCDLLVFGEAILPGYPFWLSFTNGAEFNSTIQKELYAHYLKNSVQIEKGDLSEICTLANKYQLSVYLGTIERAKNRGGHSLYCSLVFINAKGKIETVHRKLQPTYEERLVWAPGDGHGLQVHDIKNFCAGGLNCWENWIPMARTALYAQGENLHIAVWPGAYRNTVDISPFIAKESRSYVVSVSGLMRKTDIPADIPHYELIRNNAPDIMADGGSCIVAPDGKWVVEPVINKEALIIADINISKVYEERQNFDASGHYSRPDVLKLNVNRERQTPVNFE
ncbi:MAG: carbon-nitrogen hydrolase family protein [Bacteroidales bacterium]|nr:carbon-nitrogen hydrolase family protein [Bacteroidales bacterium]